MSVDEASDPFGMSMFDTGGTVVLSVTGDIEMEAVAEFARGLRDAVMTASRCVEVDLSGVGYLGAEGVRELASAAQASTEGGVDFRIVRWSDAARRVIEAIGMGRLLF